MSDAQTSSRRAEASRENAKRSTGPRNTERSRYNALKHGLRARSPILPGEDAEALRARHDIFNASIAPQDEVERLLVNRLVKISWRLDRVDRALEARAADPDPDEAARLAEEADFVALMGRRLIRDPRGPTCFYPQWETTLGKIPRVSWSKEVDDPNDPVRIVIALEARALGCAWLLDRWAELRGLLDDGLYWQPHDQFKAVRLLGRQPIDAVDDSRVIAIYLACWAMNEDGGYPLDGVALELDNAERKRFVALLNERKVMRWMPEDAEAGEAALRSLIDAEESRLEEILAGHLARAEAAAAARAAHDPSPVGERLRRDEQACDRAVVRIIEALRKRRREAAGPRDPGRAPVDKKRDKAGDAAKRIGQLLDFLAPGQGEAAILGAAPPADGDTPAPPKRRRPRPPLVPAETDESSPPAAGQAENGEIAPAAPTPVQAASDPDPATPPDSSPAPVDQQSPGDQAVVNPGAPETASRPKPAAPDPRNATNEANDWPDGPRNATNEASDWPDGPRNATNEANDWPDGPRNATNEANGVPDYPARSLQSLLTPVLASIVLLISIKTTAARAIPPRIHEQASPPRWTRNAQSKPIGHPRLSSFILHPSSFPESRPITDGGSVPADSDRATAAALTGRALPFVRRSRENQDTCHQPAFDLLSGPEGDP
jgi:hypothetical protein